MSLTINRIQSNAIKLNLIHLFNTLYESVALIKRGKERLREPLC